MKRRSVKIAGVLFTAEGPGRYHSKCGRWGVFHMLAGRVDAQWELHRMTKDKLPGADVIDYAITLGEIRFHAERGDFKLDQQ